MRLPEGAASRLIPEFDPPREALPRELFDIADRMEGGAAVRPYGDNDRQRRRSYLWASAINLVGLAALPERCWHFSAGFIYVQPQILETAPRRYPVYQSFVFGACALAEAGDEIQTQRLDTLEAAGLVFPLVVTTGAYAPHGEPPNVRTTTQQGSSACWLRQQPAAQYAQWQYGILTCRHVVDDLKVGDPVAFDPTPAHASPAAGTLGDINACTLDAAVLKIDASDWPAGLQRLRIPPAVAANDAVTLHGRHTAAAGTVLRVFQFDKYYGNLLGQRLVVDCTGRRGDSGGLLMSQASGDAIGLYLYMGQIPDGNNGYDGICQDMRQAARFFEFEAYL